MRLSVSCFLAMRALVLGVRGRGAEHSQEAVVFWSDVTSTDSSVIGTLNVAVWSQLVAMLALPLLFGVGEMGYILVLSVSVSTLSIGAVETMVSVTVRKVVLSVLEDGSLSSVV